MKFEYASKSQEYDASGATSATKVILKNTDGAIIPVFLPPENIDLSNTELLNAALEVIYQENFPQRAETEKFNLLGEKIDEYNTLNEKAAETIAKMEAQMTKQQEQSKTAQLTLINVISKLYEKEVLTDEDLAETSIVEIEGH
ncbi:DUF1366 domain-containing protein [Streptococcus salivarius]|uniref:DUF1366 domain-containing protein n=1 Tax=Streptococcus salivarius TaxID=1304 RepID=UPI0039C143F1